MAIVQHVYANEHLRTDFSGQSTVYWAPWAEHVSGVGVAEFPLVA